MNVKARGRMQMQVCFILDVRTSSSSFLTTPETVWRCRGYCGNVCKAAVKPGHSLHLQQGSTMQSSQSLSTVWVTGPLVQPQVCHPEIHMIRPGCLWIMYKIHRQCARLRDSYNLKMYTSWRDFTISFVSLWRLSAPRIQCHSFVCNMCVSSCERAPSHGQQKLFPPATLQRLLNQLDPTHFQLLVQVKDLLENGHTLHKPLLNTVLQRFAAFVHSVGMKKSNVYLLPILTFIQKCCGVSDALLEQMLDQYRLSDIVFGTVPTDGVTNICTPLNRQRRSRTHCPA